MGYLNYINYEYFCLSVVCNMNKYNKIMVPKITHCILRFNNTKGRKYTMIYRFEQWRTRGSRAVADPRL